MNAFAAIWNGTLSSRVGRRILGVLALVLTLLSLLFLTFFVAAYRERLIAEHARASTQVNNLLEAALKNAMLKRDIDGLRAILAELARQEDISAVFIVNRQGEVRFSSDPGLEGTAFAATGILQGKQAWQFVDGGRGEEVLRTIHPVHNELRCLECHGTVVEHPVNGTLVVDYRAGDVRRASLISAALLGVAGGAVLIVGMATIAIVLHHRVLSPLQLLTAATGRFADGDLASRVVLQGNDELSNLGTRFNDMAERIGSMVESLRGSEDFLQRVIDAVPDGVRVIAEDFRILKVNDAYCRQLGIASAEAVGKPCHLSSHGVATPCSSTLLTCPLEELRGGEVAALKCRHRHLRKDGGDLFVEVSAARAVLHDGSHDIVCVVESIRDLAEQSKASHQHRLSEIGQIAAGIAHEIHNPLWSIHMALTAVREDMTRPEAAAAASDYIDIADREINRCLEVTSRLLRMSEPASAEKVIVDVGPLLRDVAALVSHQALSSGVAVKTRISGSPRIIASEGDLGIVALNLMQNAVHAMPGGGQLHVSCEVAGDQVEIRFSDTGVGIAEVDLVRIFWPFWSRRADGSSGSGLGLSICKAAVERMNGTISVTSKVGKGTEFTVVLPDADRMTGQRDERNARQADPDRRGRCRSQSHAVRPGQAPGLRVDRGPQPVGSRYDAAVG